MLASEKFLGKYFHKFFYRRVYNVFVYVAGMYPDAEGISCSNQAEEETKRKFALMEGRSKNLIIDYGV